MNQLSLKYYIQDFGIEWDYFSNKLKQLTGSVSLVYSNYALMWIEDIETTAQNIAKFLAHDGVFYANIYLFECDYSWMTPEEKNDFEMIINIPSVEEQINRWKKALFAAGLVIIECNVIKRKEKIPIVHANSE